MTKKIILLFLSLTFLSTYSQELSEIKKVPLQGSYSNPIMSPTGEYLLLTTSNFNGVYLYNLKTRKITSISKTTGSGYGYSWSNDGEQFFFKEKSDNDYVSHSVVKSYNIKTKSIQKLDINPNFLPSFKGSEVKNNIVIYTNITTLKIEAKDLNTSKTWIVTPDEGQFYNAILSHDQKKVAVHNGPAIYIYHTDGSGIITKIGPGIATSWSKDDQYIIGFMDESQDGHNISNSELYLFEVASSKSKKITNTESVFEMYPQFYDRDYIIFSDDKTGQIFTSKIKL